MNFVFFFFFFSSRRRHTRLQGDWSSDVCSSDLSKTRTQSPEAKFGYTEVRIGFIPAIVSVFLIRQIGEKRARDLLLTGRIFDAEEAQRMGLVTEVVSREELMDIARELAGALVAASPTSLARTKRLLCRFAEEEIDRELACSIE